MFLKVNIENSFKIINNKVEIRSITILVLIMLIFQLFTVDVLSNKSSVKLGNEVLLDDFYYLIDGKNIGLVTNQTGVDSQGNSFIDNLITAKRARLIALFAPEHGLDGTARAGAWVRSYNHPDYDIPVYSLYGSTRMPTEEMLMRIEVLIFDIQDIGARTYTYMSTLQGIMNGIQLLQELKENEEYQKIPVIVQTSKINMDKIAKNLGASLFVTKPFEINDFIKKVKGILQESQEEF